MRVLLFDMANIQDISALLKQLCWKRRDDATTPSIHLSWLYAEKMFYGSVVRYDQSFARGSKVMFWVKDANLGFVIDRLVDAVRTLPEPEPRSYAANESHLTLDEDDIPF